jgi:hypothetical protein
MVLDVIWYGIGGWASRGTGHGGRRFNVQQRLCSGKGSLVTSALFLLKLVLKGESSVSPCGSSPHGLSFASDLLLLQTYLAVSATWYVMRGSHDALPIADLYAATDAQLSTPARAGGASAGWTQAPGNAWPRVIQSAVRFQDEHMSEIARALGHPGTLVLFCPCCRWRGELAPAPALEGIESWKGRCSCGSPDSRSIGSDRWTRARRRGCEIWTASRCQMFTARVNAQLDYCYI